MSTTLPHRNRQAEAAAEPVADLVDEAVAAGAGSAAGALLRRLHTTPTVAAQGRVVQAVGTTLRATGLRARIGQTC
ncbi:MAG TPA: hypothetical protein VLA16_01775, partial [Ideonella sp.]|nr:hypothetical protein [Ideonella sp.]